MKLEKLVRTITTMLVLAVGALFLSACAAKHTRHHNSHAAHPVKANVVVIKNGHAHGKSCGHYRYHKKWYHQQGHVHGRKCGHGLVGGIWVFR